MALKVTLDTNVLIDPAKAAVLARIKRLAVEGSIDLAVTTRVVADKDQDKDDSRKLQHLAEFLEYERIGSIGRWNMSRWDGGDVWA